MRIEQIKQAIMLAYKSRQPLMIWGKPGVGKSAAGNQAAMELKVDLIDLRLSLLEPVDLRGIPTISNKTTSWTRPEFLPTTGKGILFLDELPQAPPSMQAAASQLVLDRRIGEYKLPDGWSVIAAGNRASDRSATFAMPRHLANRFVHLNAEESVEDWVKWALEQDIDIRIIAFIKFRPTLLCNFDPQVKGEAYASPRSWEFVHKLLSAGMNGTLIGEMVAGAVGPAAAAEFMGFLRVFESMPDPDSVILAPDLAPIPNEPAALYALSTALTQRTLESNFERVLTYFNRVTASGRPEFSVMAVTDIVARLPKVRNTRAFIKWASDNNSVLV